MGAIWKATHYLKALQICSLQLHMILDKIFNVRSMSIEFKINLAKGSEDI